MIDKIASKYQLEEKQQRNALIFTLSILVFQSVFTLLLLAFKGVPTSLLDPIILSGVNIISALASYMLYRKNQPTLGIKIIFGVQVLTLLGISFLYTGITLPIGLFILIIVNSLAAIIMPINDARIAIKSVNGIVVLAIIQDLINPLDLNRIIINNAKLSWIVSGIFALVFLALIMRQFHAYTLRTKLMLSLISLSMLIVSISFTFANINTRNILKQNAEQRLKESVRSTSQSVDLFLSYSGDTVAVASTYLDFRAYLLLPPKERHGSQTETQARNLLHALSNRNPSIISYGLLDINGNNILDSNTKNIGLNEAKYEYFQLPYNERNTYISSLLYLPEKEPSLFFSVPVYSETGLPLGVLRAQYRASALQDIIDKTTGIAGEGSYLALLDENHVILAHGLDSAFIGKFPVAPQDKVIESLKKRYILPEALSNNKFSLNRPIIEMGLNQYPKTPYFSSPKGETEELIFGVITKLELAPWLIVAVQPQEIFIKTTQKQTKTILSVATAVIFFAALFSFGLSYILFLPVTHLQYIAQKFSEGNLNVRASVETKDEIGALATTFNIVATRMRSIVDTLEEHVRERTKELELRTTYLEGSADVSRAASSITDPDQLAWQVVDLIKKRFDLYYVGLFLADREDKWAVLKAGTGQAGETMLANKHRLKIGEGMIGWAIANAEARIALDVGEDAVRFENPILPETRSEGALPLRSRGRVLGALTVQSNKAAAFTPEIITTLQTMVDQIAIAFDNAELLAKREAALKAERRAYGELSRRSWQELTRTTHIPAYSVTAEGKQQVFSKEEFSKEMSVIREGQIIQKDGVTALLPIKSRGQVLGGIRITKSSIQDKWTKEQIQLAESLSEQLGVALDSARLFDQTQRKAEREAILSDISSKIGASIRMDSIIKTTVKELGEALGSTDVSFRLINVEEKSVIKNNETSIIEEEKEQGTGYVKTT